MSMDLTDFITNNRPPHLSTPMQRRQFGKALSKWRRDRALTYAKLAHFCILSPTTIKRIVLGSKVNHYTLEKLIRGINELDDIYGNIKSLVYIITDVPETDVIQDLVHALIQNYQVILSSSIDNALPKLARAPAVCVILDVDKHLPSEAELKPLGLPLVLYSEKFAEELYDGPQNRVAFSKLTDTLSISNEIPKIIDHAKGYRAAKNAQIERLVSATPLAEEIVLRDGKFDIEYLPTRELFDKNINRLSDAVDNAIKANAFNANSNEIQFIRGIISDHKDNPQRVHDDCIFVHAEIASYIIKDIISDSFEVKRLQNAIQQTVDDLRAYESEIRKVNEVRNANTINPSHIIDSHELISYAEKIQNIQSPRTNSEIMKDVLILGKIDAARQQATIRLSHDAQYRLISRYTRMYTQIVSITSNASSSALVEATPYLLNLIEQLRPLISFIGPIT